SARPNQSQFLSPYDLTRLPILCPREYDPARMALVPVAGCALPFAFDTRRTVLGAYIDPQWRPSKELILDAGARLPGAPPSTGTRLQVAPPSLGTLTYALEPTFAGTIVWSFIPNWHLKLNYAQGFRPPVFNNTTSNGEGLQIAGNPNLKVETSEATQAEVNAR